MAGEPAPPTRTAWGWGAPAAPPRADRIALLWALALLVPLLLKLGGAPLFDVDEGAFSEATRQMLASGDFGHTMLHGVDRFDKPIGVYWVQAASAAIFGNTPLAYRLPSVLSTWALALALGWFAWQRWGRAAGALSGLIVVTSLGMLGIGRAATADGLLNLLLGLTALDLWRHLETGARAPLRRAALWIGLGLLTKGPVAVVVPGAAWLVWVATSGRWRDFGRSLADPWAWVLMLGTSLPWYAYALHRHGQAFIDGFFLRHNVERFSGTLEGHGAGIGYYLVVLPLLWLPWSALGLTVLVRVRALWADPLGRFLLAWSGFVVGFFSLSGTKLPHYVLYAGPALVLLWTGVAPQAGRWVWRLAGLGMALWLAALTLAPWVVRAQASRIDSPLYRALIEGAPDPLALGVAGGALALALVAWSLAMPRHASQTAASQADAAAGFPRHLAASAYAVALLFSALALPWWAEAVQGPIDRAARFTAGRPEAVVQWGVHWPSVGMARSAPTPRRVPEAGEVAITRRDRLPAALPDGSRLQVLFEERGVVVVKRLTPG
jgi:4-amino-4-deoxy-L-arabinose transferase-like glycosyltransferase